MPDLRFLGWTDALDAAFASHAAAGLVPARVAVDHAVAFELLDAEGSRWGDLPKKLREGPAAADSPAARPAVGDWVAVERRADGRATIRAVLPRRTAFVRKGIGKADVEQVVAANVDTVFLVAALDILLKPRSLERYLALAWESGAQPVVVLSKCDLRDADDLAEVRVEAEAVAGAAPVLLVSGATGSGLQGLLPWLGPGQTVALLGPSGAGKSTIVNALLGAEVQATAEVRESDGRGRHTTTRRQLLRLPEGGMVIDTPGLRELGLWETGEGLETAFPDVLALGEGCRFADCAHDREPGCAVRRAVEEARLDEGRYQSYLQLRAELAALEARKDPRSIREKKAAGKVLARAIRSWKHTHNKT